MVINNESNIIYIFFNVSGCQKMGPKKKQAKNEL